MRIKSTKTKKFFLGLLMAIMILAPFSQHETGEIERAEAQIPVTDAGAIFLLGTLNAEAITIATATGVETFKDTVLDTIAWGVVNIIIDEMTRQTVNWISGRTGEGPQFVTDLPGFLGSLGNKVAGEFLLNEIPLVCSPFQLQVRAKLIDTFRQEQRFQCTLTEAISNVTNYNDFISGNFFKGGWEGWLSVSLPQNNFRGATLEAQTAIGQRIAQLQSAELAKLDWGQGFLSWEQCPDTAVQSCPPTVPGGAFKPGDSCSRFERICLEKTTDEKGRPVLAPVRGEIRTPGTVVQEQLNKAIGVGQERLLVADEINELVGALFTRLVSEILSNPRGLLGQDINSIDNTTPQSDLCADYGICGRNGPGGGGTLPSQDDADSGIPGTPGAESDYIRLWGVLNSFTPGVGYSALVSWSSEPEVAEGDVTLTLSGGSFGSGQTVGINGSATETLAQNTTYTLTAVGTILIDSGEGEESGEEFPGPSPFPEPEEIEINESVSIHLLATTGSGGGGSDGGGGLPVGSVFFASNGTEYCDDDQNDEFGILRDGGPVRFHINDDNGATFFIIPYSELGTQRCQDYGNFGGNPPFSPTLTFTSGDQDQTFTLPPSDESYTLGSYGGQGGPNEAFLTLLTADGSSGGGGSGGGSGGSTAPDFNSISFWSSVINISDNSNSLNFRSKLKMARGGSASWDSSGSVLSVRWEEVPGWGQFLNEEGVLSFGQLHIIAFVESRGAWYDWNIEDLQRPGENGGTEVRSNGLSDWVEAVAFAENSPDEGFRLRNGDWFGLYIAAMPGGTVRSDILPVQYFEDGGSAVGSLNN